MFIMLLIDFINYSHCANHTYCKHVNTYAHRIDNRQCFIYAIINSLLVRLLIISKTTELYLS